MSSLYAAKLKESGHDVSILARGPRLEQIRRDGIVLEDEGGGRRSVVPVPAVDGLGPCGRHDLILVVMRKDQVGSVLPALAAHRATPSVLFMMNNAAGPDEFIAAVGRERVLLGFPGAGGAREGGVVRYSLTSSKLQLTTIGELDGAVTPRIQALAEVLSGAGCPTVVSRDMDAWLKTTPRSSCPSPGRSISPATTIGWPRTKRA
ncbi:MAG TPA: 2-dehydropantoate 2-reductase N-terminal domain-containing protein [Bacillota bacterium]|jgi:2-dehydropantoate 2-reductase